MSKRYQLVEAGYICRTTVHNTEEYVCLYYRNAAGKEKAEVVRRGERGFAAAKKAAMQFQNSKTAK